MKYKASMMKLIAIHGAQDFYFAPSYSKCESNTGKYMCRSISARLTRIRDARLDRRMIIVFFTIKEGAIPIVLFICTIYVSIAVHLNLRVRTLRTSSARYLPGVSRS